MENTKSKLYWIVDHETLHWAPGKFNKEKINELNRKSDK